MEKIIICGLNPTIFKTETLDDDVRPDRDLANFAAWYQHVQLQNPGQVSELTSKLKKVIECFDQLSLEKTGLDSRALMVRFSEKDKRRRYSLRLSEISDGQRSLIAIYALLLLSENDGNVLFLDEPENYVALSEIQPWLMEVYDNCGILFPQVVICSHHPELIDYLGPENGILLSRESGGIIRVAKAVDKISPECKLKLSEILARGWEQ